MEYLAKMGNIVNLTLTVLTVSGHLYLTDLILNNNRVDGKLCFTTKVDTKALIVFLAMGIFLEIWGILKIILDLAGVDFPIGCGGGNLNKIAQSKMKGVKAKAVAKNPYVLGAIFLFILIILTIGGLNLYVYALLIKKLQKATVDPENPKNKCIPLSGTEHRDMKRLIYLNWAILILSIVYNTWVSVWCPVSGVKDVMSQIPTGMGEIFNQSKKYPIL
jgi:hypothetical protein